jgi:sphingosine kinase
MLKLLNQYFNRPDVYLMSLVRMFFLKKYLKVLSPKKYRPDTTHRKHAYEIAKDLSLEYDAVVVLSGDGLIHEVINGLADHERPTDALAIPIAPIPTGSGNALSLNLLGKEVYCHGPGLSAQEFYLFPLQDGFDVAAAALNVLKGEDALLK